MAGVPRTHNQKGSLGLLKNIPSLFSDVPVGMVENVAPKRKLDDSCLDDSYETPAKKPYVPSTYSPDLGLDCDSFNVDTPKAVKCTSSPKTGILMPKVVPVNRDDSLKFNINGLCLSPIICNTRHPIRAGNTVDGRLCPRSRGPLAPNPRAGRQVAEEEQSTDWAREGYATLGGEHTVDDSFEDSLPLQLQLKSAVVVVKSHASSSNGPMSQLHDLMGHVAEQHRWQHPSDLTARNYQRRFGNMTPRMSLSEWKARSSRNHQGFSSVPEMFHRSPVP
ncbi:hypothetical protein CRUP_004514 [Coryphaenoides rupestris]|nr:hypothetical protein CRUP_004514 [Coryphaenoides rupestris]